MIPTSRRLDAAHGEAQTTDTPMVRIWAKPERPLGRLLVWNTGGAAATVALVTTPRIDADGNPAGPETVIASATVAAGATHIFDGTPSGGGPRDTSPYVGVRYSAATPGQPTTLQFATVAG